MISMTILINLAMLFSLSIALPIPGFLLVKPKDDTFYSAPSNLDSLANGEVYNSRSVFNSIPIDTTLAHVEQVAYKTTNSQGESSHSVATVIKPLVPASDAKILSYQVYEDAANLDCSPSYLLATDLTGLSTGSDVTISLLAAINKGWYVIVPDHEGPRSAFIAGYEQGQAGLDGIQAGINYLGLDQKTPVALLGYSGGGSATVWMANLQESYAPNLNIVGAAHGGTPIDLFDTVKFLDKASSLFSSFIVPAFSGILSAYPSLESNIWPHFDKTLQNAINSTRSSGTCIIQNIVEFEHQSWHTMMDIDPYTYPPLVKVFNNQSLLSNVSTGIVSVPKFPRYIWHAVEDQIIPFTPVQQYVSEQCSAGANIQFVPWKRDDHATVEYLGLPDSLQFVLQALEYRTPSVPCGAANNDILTLTSTSLADELGQPVADLINALSTVTTPFGNIILNITNGYTPW